MDTNLTHELEVDAVERTGESTAVYLTITHQGETINELGFEGNTAVLFDSVNGKVYWPIVNGNPTHDDTGHYGSGHEEPIPFFEGVHNEVRMYFPALPDDLDTVTFMGIGAGAIPGVPVTDVDEHQPGPDLAVDDTSLDSIEGLDSDPEPGATLTRPDYPPDGSAQEHVFDAESVVDGAGAALTRQGSDETLALDADVLFEGDDGADLTDGAGEVLSDTSATIQHNAKDGGGTLGIAGPEERAQAVAEELEPDLGDDFDVEVSGVGGDTRVELSYEAASPADADTGDGQPPIAAAQRHVEERSQARAFDEPAATEEHNGFQLDVYPLQRDGAHVVAVFDLTNTGESEKELPDLRGDDSSRPQDAGTETLDGFRLVEPNHDLTRHPLIVELGDEHVGLTNQTSDVKADETRRMVAVYPAPSANTDTVTLAAGPFGDVTELAIE